MTADTSAQPRKNRPYRGKMPEAILDVLTTDGGWLSSVALAERLGVGWSSWTSSAGLRALLRLRAQCLVESRPMHARVGGNPMHEWRATDEAETWL